MSFINASMSKLHWRYARKINVKNNPVFVFLFPSIHCKKNESSNPEISNAVLESNNVKKDCLRLNPKNFMGFFMHGSSSLLYKGLSDLVGYF